MKTGVRDIVGKQITGVIIKHAKDSHHHPSSMLMLVFEDGTYYEFYTHVGRFRPYQLWKMSDPEHLRGWGEDQLWTELIAWYDDDEQVRLQMMSDDGHLKEVQPLPR